MIKVEFYYSDNLKVSKLDKYKLMWGVSLTGVPFNTTINSNNVDVIYPSIYGSVTKNNGS